MLKRMVAAAITLTVNIERVTTQASGNVLERTRGSSKSVRTKEEHPNGGDTPALALGVPFLRCNLGREGHIHTTCG